MKMTAGGDDEGEAKAKRLFGQANISGGRGGGKTVANFYHFPLFRTERLKSEKPS